ncbi:MAG: histidine phosphatase family protein [Marmoricola sp.]
MLAPVYLVRHGQSEWNVLRLTQGQTSHPRLTALGHAQAVAAAELIARDLDALGHTPHRVVTSDLARARETAEVLGRHLDVTVESDERLREQHLGVLEGRTYEETWAAADALDWSDPEAAVEGGESMSAVRRRMTAVLSDLSPDRVHVLVSHGDAIRVALAHLHGQEPNQAPWVEVPNGAVARFDGALTWLG